MGERSLAAMIVGHFFKRAVPQEKCSNGHFIMKRAEIPNEQNILLK